MDQNFFSQNSAFQNISPEKLAFLMNFMNQEKPNSSRDMKQNLSQADQQRVDQVLRLLKRKSS